jgi:hypothetical protein
MSDFSIKCNYELPALLQQFLGAEILTAYCRMYNIFLGIPGNLSIYGDIQFKAIFGAHTSYKPVEYTLRSVSKESPVGELYGVTFTDDVLKTNDLSMISTSGTLEKIVGIGEIQHETIKVCNFNTTDVYLHDDLSTFREHTEFEYWFPDAPSSYQIDINKKTLDVIGLGFDTGKWVYIFPERNGEFRIEFNSETTPELLCSRWDYVAMEKKLQILQVFE